MPGVVAFLRRNARKIGSLALILFIAGIAILVIIPTRYASTALVLVDPRELHVTTDPDVLPGIGQDAAALQSLVEVAKSDGFLRPLIGKLKIADDDDIADGERNTSKLLYKFRKRLSISRRGLTYVIAFTFKSSSPQRAAYYANAVAEAFVVNQNQAHTSATNEAASWLNGHLKTLGDQVKAADDAVAAFKAEHKIIDAGKDSTTRQLRVTELSRQVAAAQLLTEKAKNRYEQARRNLKANVEGPTGSRPDLLSMLRAQRTQLNDQIAQKRAVLGDRHPDLVIAYSRLAELNQQIKAERKRSIDSARSDYETQLDQQKALEKQLTSLESKMAKDVQASVKLQELQRNADASRRIYEQFLSRYKETNAQRKLQTTQVRIVSHATAPIRPTRPALPLILVALVLASLLSACAIVSLIEQAQGGTSPIPEAEVRDNRPTENPGEPTVPVWGRIPNVATSLADKLGWHAAPVRNAEADLRAYLGELLDIVTAAPTSRGRVVLVTSSRPKVGKSSVAQSVNAAALDRGLMSVLIRTEPDSPADVKSELPLEPATSNRRQVLSATTHSLTLLLGDSPEHQAPSGDVRSEFDLIVIDAPVFGQHDDVPAIAAHSDFTVLVMTDNIAAPDMLARAQAMFSRSGNIRLGAIINDPHPVNRAESAGTAWHPQRSANVA
jgi:uncharacterized protein involved in exopolysaccharide biosynthesis/Mrp family chromosome partitioning ATPase